MTAYQLLAEALQRELERRGLTLPVDDCESALRATIEDVARQHQPKAPTLVPVE